MKKVSGFTKRMVAILLSSMLAVGTIPGTALAAEVQENTVQEKETITTYTVTLDANGGYFENEWDDVLGEYIESTEILNKQIPIGGTVATFPVFENNDQETQPMFFSGWSMDRDGELVSQVDEEYTPVDNCVLYAVWEPEELLDNGEETDLHESDQAEDNDEDDSSQEQEDTVSYDEEDAGDVIDDVEDQEEPVSENDDQAEEPVDNIKDGESSSDSENDQNSEDTANDRTQDEVTINEPIHDEMVSTEKANSTSLDISQTVIGRWKGEYDAKENDGNIYKRSIILTIYDYKDGQFNGLFEYTISDFQGGLYGSYYCNGSIDNQTGEFSFQGYSMVVDEGYYSHSSFTKYQGTMDFYKRQMSGTVGSISFLFYKDDSDLTIDPESVVSEYYGFHHGSLDGEAIKRNSTVIIEKCSEAGAIEGSFIIYPIEGADNQINGKYQFDGYIDLYDGRIVFIGKRWLQYPDIDGNYRFQLYKGIINANEGTITGDNGTGDFKYLKKENSSINRITLEDKYVLYENNQQDIIIRADVHSEDVVPNASNMSWLFGAYSGTSISPGSLSVEGGPTDYIASYSAAFSGAGEYEIKTILYNNENMEKKLAEASAVLHVLDLHAVGMPHVTDNVRKVSVAWTGVDDAEEYELQFTRIRTDEMGRESTYNINPIVTAETQYCLKTAAVLPGDTFKVTIVPVSHGLKGSPANIVGIYVQDDLESCVNELVASMDDFLTTMNDEAERQRVLESPEEVKEKNTSAIASGARSENMITTVPGTTDAELSAIYQGYSKFIVDHFTDYVKMENIDLSNNWTQIESAFVEYVQNNFNHEEETYEINGYTVKVVTTGYGNAIDGTIVLNKDGLQKQIVHISSTTDSVQQLMTKFSKNMQDIMEAAMYDALTSVINEIGDKTGIKDWTEAKAKSAFNKVLTALRNKGFGNILDNIQKMCNIYKAANSVLDILKADSVSEANKKAKSCYETLQKIEITTATAEYSTMTAPIKKAFDKVLDKRKALEKALQYMYGGSSGSEWTSGGGIGGEVSGVDDPESDEENSAYNVSNATVTGVSAKTYTGKAITLSLTVKIGSTTLTPGTDYTVSYKNNTNAGTATVTVTGKGKYTGTKTVSFIINKAPQSITIKSTASAIAVGKTATVSITGAKGTKSFKSSDTSIATVNASTGVVTGKKAGTVTITATSAATSNYNAASKTIKITVNKVLKKPGNCHFTKWNNSKYTSCRISWNKVDGAEGYQTLLSWTDGSHASETIVKSNILYRDCAVVANHVSQMKVRAFYTAGGKRVYGPWSNVDYITPSPAKLTTKNASSGTNLKMNISWNIIYGCNGYNVFITTNPNGTWYWNQSTSEKATATSASIVKCGGAKLKKNTRYYVRIVTRRKRNGVFCTVPMPASNTYVGSFIIK